MLDPDNMPEWIRAVVSKEANYSYVLAWPNDDDCGVLEWSAPVLVATTDFLNSKPIALELGIGSYRDLGRLVVDVNLADLCGTAAEPVCLLIGCTMPRDSSRHMFEELMLGASEEAHRWQVPIIGGDTKLGDHLSIFGVGIGSAASSHALLLQAAAEPGDILWVSGPLGSCAAGVLALTELDAAEWHSWAKRAILEPQLPLYRSRQLARLGAGKAGCDISDGLGADVSRLCAASGVGVIVQASAIPFEPPTGRIAQLLGIPVWSVSLVMGGDMQFIATTSDAHRSTLEALGFKAIGRITPERTMLLELPGHELVPLPAAGHRDGRRVPFAQEIRQLLATVGGPSEDTFADI